eukprot:jgi/Galph1/3207/GphlegSOOS_G1871.1
MVDCETRVFKFQPYDRPWLSLYNRNLVLPEIISEIDIYEQPVVDKLSDDIIFQIFSRLPAGDLAACSRVCRRWNSLSYDPAHWKRICLETWPAYTFLENLRISFSYDILLSKAGGGSWRRMFLERPHVRFDGIYVSRHQYIRMGLTEGKYKQPIFLVTYFRFLRFYSDAKIADLLMVLNNSQGVCVVLTSAERPSSAMKRLRRGWTPSVNERDKAVPSIGKYEFNERTREVTVMSSVKQPKYPQMRDATVIYCLNLVSTCPGANDRLYIESHFSVYENSECPVFHSKEREMKYYSMIPFRSFEERCARLFPEEEFISSC